MMFVEIGDEALIISISSLLSLIFLTVDSSANSPQIPQTPVSLPVINRDFIFSFLLNLSVDGKSRAESGIDQNLASPPKPKLTSLPLV